MRRIAIQRLVVFLTLVVASPAPADEGAPRPFLWKVEAKGGIAWLLGSVHVAKPDIYPLDRRIEEAFAASDVLVVEADPTAEGGIAAAGTMLARGMYTPPETLEGHVSAKLLKEVTKRMEAAGLPPAQWMQYRPWLLSMTITMIELQKLGIVAQNGIDLHFLNRARGTKKIVELESVTAQLDMLSSFDDRQQELFLEYTLRDVENLEENFNEMFDTWRKGDIARLESIMKEPLRESQELTPIYKKLLDDRNVEMAKKIEGFLEERQKCFVVVGAGHMVGDKGLVKLLSAKRP